MIVYPLSPREQLAIRIFECVAIVGSVLVVAAAML